MTTQLQAVNNVLQRLREDTVSSVADTDYATMVAIFLNQAKQFKDSNS